MNVDDKMQMPIVLRIIRACGWLLVTAMFILIVNSKGSKADDHLVDWCLVVIISLGFAAMILRVLNSFIIRDANRLKMANHALAPYFAIGVVMLSLVILSVSIHLVFHCSEFIDLTAPFRNVL